MKFTSFGLAAIALALMADNTEALPAIRNYKGVSPYAAKNTVNPRVPVMKDPRGVSGARRMRLSSNNHLEETYLDELHYVSEQPESSSQFWNNVQQRLESAIDRLDKATSVLCGANAMSPCRAANAVKSAAKSLGFSFTVNSNKGAAGSLPDFTFNFNVSEPLSWGHEAELSSSSREDGVIDAKALPNLPADSGFDYNKNKVRGVNLGNWLCSKRGWIARSCKR